MFRRLLSTNATIFKKLPFPKQSGRQDHSCLEYKTQIFTTSRYFFSSAALWCRIFSSAGRRGWGNREERLRRPA